MEYFLELNGQFVKSAKSKGTILKHAKNYAEKYPDSQIVIWYDGKFEDYQ